MNTTSNLGDPSDPLFGASLDVLKGVFVYQRYTAVIPPVILIHDFLLTLDDEVCLIFSYLPCFPPLTACSQIRLIWPGPLTLPKVLYYTNRYLAIFATTYMAYS